MTDVRCQIVDLPAGKPFGVACNELSVSTARVRDGKGGTAELRLCAYHTAEARAGRLFAHSSDYREAVADNWSPAKLADVFFNGRKA